VLEDLLEWVANYRLWKCELSLSIDIDVKKNV
jgi:hypothetical protein